jgi:hypothetical protein
MTLVHDSGRFAPRLIGPGYSKTALQASHSRLSPSKNLLIHTTLPLPPQLPFTTAHLPLPTSHCPLPTARCPLPTAPFAIPHSPFAPPSPQPHLPHRQRPHPTLIHRHRQTRPLQTRPSTAPAKRHVRFHQSIPHKKPIKTALHIMQTRYMTRKMSPRRRQDSRLPHLTAQLAKQTVLPR